MKKTIFVLLFFFTFMFISGCGQDEKVEMIEPVEKEKVAPVPPVAQEQVIPIKEPEVVEQDSIEKIDAEIEKEVDKEQESIEKIDKAIEDEVDKGKLDLEKIKDTIEETAPEVTEKVTTEIEVMEDKVSPDQLMKKIEEEQEDKE